MHQQLQFPGRLALNIKKSLLTACLLCAGTLHAQPGIEWSRLYSKPGDDKFTSIMNTADGGYVVAGENTSKLPGDLGYLDFRLTKVSATGALQWEQSFGGNKHDQDTRVALAPDGGYLLAGTSRSNKSRDKSENDRALSPDNAGDFWIIKLSKDGTKQWEKTIGGDNQDLLKAVSPTPDGGYLLAGSTLSGTSGEKKTASKGSYDFWLVKIDGNGNVQWDKSFGGTGDDQLSAMKLTSDGVIIGGTSDSPLGADKTRQAFGKNDFWLVKVTFNGDKIWDKTIGGNDTDVLTDLEITSDGGFIICGNSRSGISGNKSKKSLGLDDYWVVKTDALGNVQWDNALGGTSYDYASSVIPLPEGGYAVSGYSYSRLNGNKTAPLKGLYCVWLIRLDASGTMVWNQTYGASDYPDFAVPADITLAADGSLLLAGLAKVESGTADIPMPSAGRDAWLLKLQTEGNTRQLQLSDSIVNFYASPSSLAPTRTLTVSGSVDPYVITPPSSPWLSATVTGNNVVVAANAAGLAGGSYSANVTVGAAGYASATVSVKLVVRIAPVIASIRTITVPVNQAAMFTARAAVSEGERAIFSLTDAPAGAQMDTSGRFIWTPSTPGTYIFRVKASTSRTPVLTSEREVKIVALAGNPDDVIRINAGGGDYTTADGRFFQADKYYSGIDEISDREVPDIAYTADDELYRVARCSRQFDYTIPVKRPGIYKIVMHFAETYWGVAERREGRGSRQFYVSMERQQKQHLYDIFTLAGGALKATQATLEVAVTDGFLNLYFNASDDKARLSALEIIFVKPLQVVTLQPTDDAYVRGGSYADQNFGRESTLDVKGGSRNDLNRESYMKFSLAGISQVTKAYLRIYGYKHEAGLPLQFRVFALENDDWSENTITWNDVPAGSMKEIDRRVITETASYFEFDVTEYAKSWVAGDKMITFVLQDSDNRKLRMVFNSKENGSNPPELIISTTDPVLNTIRLAANPGFEKPVSEVTSSTIFPNPVQKQLSVKISPQHHDNISLSLINAAGLTFSLKTTEVLRCGATAEVDISNLSLSKGIYLLKIQSDHASEVLKVLISD
ncbi:CBM96 family carbohydrate-binding protein [Dyadobacter sandarakinus]|uniref:DNRLRE domain-containing protein n=1 Tax=Dyadobacter sandarakinus TaxID=2747268 RepID=A0ABX7I8Z9_9BACT|nr:DNRLRE domain-containing protein [Dyadobacter sandarakinus]QRR02450.1 DNRLRE domain-containing protein [Dyadobacter sandarakinus]